MNNLDRNKDITSSKYRADEGDGITVTSVPDVGYRLESVTVKQYADHLFDNTDENGTDEQKAYAKAAPLVRAMLQ